MRAPHFIRGGVAAALLCAACAAQAQTAYQVGVLLPDIQMYAINNAGSMAGAGPAFSEGPVVYANGVLTDITPRGPGAGAAFGINDAGAVVGNATQGGDQLHAIVYQNGTVRRLDPESSTFSQAFDINNRGQIVGFGVGPNGYVQAFLYEQGKLEYLSGAPGTFASTARAINDHGQIVGDADTAPAPAPPSQAFLYENGAMQVLDLGGYLSFARDINNAGQIVGGVTVGADTSAYIYDHGKVTLLGTLGGPSSFAEGINTVGQVVGMSYDATGNNLHGFLYDQGKLADLSVLTAGWIINAAYDINDKGQITAAGCRIADNVCGALRLDPIVPVPEPAGWAMLALGVLLAGVARLRLPRAP